MLAALVVALALLRSSAAPAQDPSHPACEVCKDRGVVACKLCASKPCKSDRGYSFCSVEGECSDCGGSRLRECNLCEHLPEVKPAERRDAIAKWRETLRPLDEFMGVRDLVHLESAHFVLTFDVKRIDNKAAATQHEAAHLYLDRLEKLFGEFATDTAAQDADFSAKTQVMVWSNEKEQEKASGKYTLEKSTTQAKLMGAKPVVSIAYGKGRVRSDDELYRALVHQVSHCLLSNLYDGVWTGNIQGGWLDEGVAFLYEQRAFGDVRTWCYLSDEKLKELKLGRFEAEVLEHLPQAPDATRVMSLDTVAMTPEQRIFAWSYCDYVTRAHPGKLGAIAKVVKKRKPVSEALLAGLERSITDFELDWSTWVKATYSAKAKR